MSCLRLLNAGFGEPLGHELPALKALGVEGVRTDCQHQTPEVTAERAKEIVDAGLVPIIVVATLEQLALLPAGTMVEWKNEPDLEMKGQARAYGEQVQAFTAACEAHELQGCAGAISNLIDRGFNYLEAAGVRRWSEQIIVEIHWYPHKDSPHEPHPGSRSREHEVEKLKALIGNRRWDVGEFGYRTSRADAADNIRFEWAFWERMGAEFAALFQLNDGLGKDEHWGIRDVAGNWKPAADTFRRTT